MGSMLAKPEVLPFRKIDVLRQRVTLSREQNGMANNTVITSKYNLLTFVPRSLFEQFRRIANIYFLVMSILMVMGTYTTLFISPLTPISTLLPLCGVLLVTMVKDGLEDLKRHRSDKKVNNTEALALDIDNQGGFVTVPWKDVRVGMIIKVVDREEMPADLIMLTSSEPGGVAYIETANIDGETNLKIRTSAPTRPRQPPGPAWTSADELHGVCMEMEYEAPNPRIHFFTGTLTVGGGRGVTADAGESGQASTAAHNAPLDQSNLLLRGSRLRNTKWVLGIVAYTGKESKIAQNARSVPSKQSNLDKVTNKIMFVIFTCMAVVTTLSLVGYLIFSAENDSVLYYLCDNYEDAPVPLFQENCEDSDSSSDAGQWFTFLILFNNFVPISLYVTLELVNYIQAAFIDEDIHMYDEGQDTPAQARSANMAGDLGQVEYVFSDKTGTLTQNLMKFKRCSVGGSIYGEIEQAVKKLMNPQQLSHVVDAPPLSALADIAASEGGVALDFALCLALNHTVMLEEDRKTWTKRMQAESPDEEALVDGAKMLGVEFVDRSPGNVQLKMTERGQQTYRLIVTIPFDSTRKRMSVIVQAPDGSYTLYCKGADNIIMERASRYVGTDKVSVTSHLGVFSNDGLRTLLLGKRSMSKGFLDKWYKKYQEASIATNDRAELIAEAAKEVEVDLDVIGVTAIEDKLQDEVPSTIADLGKAGVKLWVLTGDKMETAINIGYSCRLLEPEMTLIKLKEKPGDPNSVSNQLRALMVHFNRLVEDDGLVKRLWGHIKSNAAVGVVRRTVRRRRDRREGGDQDGADVATVDEDESLPALPEPVVEQPEGAPPLSELSAESLALVVDGPSLVHVLGDPEAERMLLALGSMCKSVIACRVSPAQKRLIVRLVKRGVVPTPVTLAIGDGANDVGMIQEAQIGVGISGKEGRQAVNNADFAIAQFRFLKRLMLVHGHWDYRRLCKVILYSFHKNFVLVFILFYFCFYTGFSGQSLFESIVYSAYNFFLAMPILLVGVFDKDVGAETALECHKLYAIGRLGMDLNIRVMIKWVIQAILDSLVVYFMVFAAYKDSVTIWAHRGYGEGLYVFGTTVYGCLFMAMILKVFNLTTTWNWQSWLFFWGSIAFFFAFIAVYSLVVSLAYNYYYVAFQLMSRVSFWLLMIQVPCVTWSLDVFIRMAEHMFTPNVGNHATEFDHGFTSESGLDRLRQLKARVVEEYFDSCAERVRELAGPRRDESARQKWKMGPDAMRVLNETVPQSELDEMGISEGTESHRKTSSYAFDHVTANFGPGASAAKEELRSLVEEEGVARVVSIRERSLRRWDSEAMSTFDIENYEDALEITHEIDEDEGPSERGLGASQDSAAGSTFAPWSTLSATGGSGVFEGKDSEF